MLMSLFQHILVHTTIYFCFQCHRTNSKLNAEDLVWFEEPDTKFKTLNVPQRNIFKERGCHKVTDIVWFKDPDLGHYNTEQFLPIEVRGKNKVKIDPGLSQVIPIGSQVGGGAHVYFNVQCIVPNLYFNWSEQSACA